MGNRRTGSLAKLALATVAIVALALFFVWFTGLALRQALVAFDERTVLLFRDPSDVARSVGPSWLAEAIRDFTALGSVTVVSFLVLLTSGFLLLVGQRRECLFIAVSSAGSLALNSILKHAIEMPRPMAIDVTPLVFTSSFPSGHAALSAATYFSLALVASRWVDRLASRYLWIAAIALIALVGVSRVYLGLHRPSEALAGWTVGLAWFLLNWALVTSLNIS
jgi:undecaprenyl-diphosphatase